MTIHDIEQKISNDGATPKGQLTAEEFNTVVSTVVKHDGEITRVTYWDMVNNTQYGFASEDDRDKWLDGDVTVAPTQVTKFQFAGKQRVMKVINLMPSTNIYFTTNQAEAIISASFVSQEKEITASDWTTIPEDAFFSVYVDKGGTGTYQEVLANKLVLDGNTFTFDVKNYLATGANRVRIVAVGSSSGESGSLQLSVNLTSMFIEPSNFTWYTPFIEGQPYRLGGFRIGGNIVKSLKVKVSKEGYEKIYEQYLGTNTYLTTAYSFNGLEFPEAGSGVYNVECWLDANGLESDHLSYNIIFVSAADHASGSTQMVAINNFADKVYNFSDNRLFQYCIYNGGLTVGTPHVRLASLVNNTPTIFLDEDLANVRTGAALDYIASLEVELQDENLEITLDARMIYGNEQQVLYAVDNSKSYPAATGASFYLNASSRNNAQENREFVVNAVNSAAYEATFNRMAWTDGVDGWTTDDEGRKCLRLPAMSPMEFAFKPLATVPQEGKTIEFLFKVKNVADYNEPIISITNTDGDDFAGIRITPKNVLIHSADAKDDSVQDYNTIDEEVLDVIISIIPTYKEVYGSMAKIYVNGENVRTFEYTAGDRWNVDSIVKLGNQTSDFFLYKMRVYERGFQSTEARDNYINSLPTTKEKEAKKAELYAPTDDNGYALSYDSCVKNKLNTMVIEILGNDQTIPSIQNQSAKQCNLWVTITDPIAGELDEGFATLFSGSPMLDQTIEGQGTTAMTYSRWNFRWKLDKTYGKRRITAKKNVASSMHSHKMGATRLFSDLNARCVGANDAGKRVAVYQYPVYGFQKIKREGTANEYDYIPIGLYTIGPDKGDKETFGFDDERFESTIIHMEGTDHTPLGVGMDYPWDKLIYDPANEGFGAKNASNSVVTAWEVGACGEYEVGTYQEYEGGPILNDATEVRAMLNVEFQPAYDVAYNNSTYIEGVTETLQEINANVKEWRKKVDAQGRKYTILEFWTDGVYDLYYYNTQTETYEANGVNVLSDLGLTTSAVSGMTVTEKNELFKRLRRERFSANWGSYWHTQDAIFHYAFVEVFGATDNFKKNTYPYKFKALNDGGLWRWRQDDLDTLFDINNQGFAAKTYSILVGDSTETGNVYRGEDSVFWTLVKETQQDAIKEMVHRIFDNMVEMSPYGNNTIEKIVGCIRYYFWDKAQNYFPATAYNADAEWTYEETWAAGWPNGQGISQLRQSLGGHYEAERDWVTMRALFMASYFNYGPFNPIGYQDVSTGQLSYGGAGEHTFTFKPSVDFNPTAIVGQSGLVTVGERVNAGATVDLSITADEDTRVYVQGIDWMEDIGDLSTLIVASDSSGKASLSVESKRLQRLKIGDGDASKVSSNISELTFGREKGCPSMMIVDARNLASLSGAIDLTKLPRLMEAYFGGTSVTSIAVPNGSKIQVLQLTSELTQLSLQNLKFLNDDTHGRYIPEIRNGYWVRTSTGVGTVCPLQIIADANTAYCVTSCEGYSNARISGDGGNGNRLWAFLDKNNVMLSVAEPFAQETDLLLDIPDDAVKIAVNFQISTNANYSFALYPKGVGGLIYDSLDKVRLLRIEGCDQLNPFDMLKSIYNSENHELRDVRIVGFVSDGDANDLTMISNMVKDKDKNGNDHIYNGVDANGNGVDDTNPVIEGTLNINSGAYEDDIATLKGAYPNLVLNILGGIYIKFEDPEVRRVLLEKITTDDGYGLKVEDVESVTSIGKWFNNNQIIEYFNELQRFTGLTFIYGGGNSAAFYNCTSLKEVTLPETVKEIQAYAFTNCSALSKINLEECTHFRTAAFRDCVSLKEASFANAIVIDQTAFSGCTSLEIEDLPLPNLTSLGQNAFYGVKIKKISDLGKITALPTASSNTQNFGDKSVLEEVVLPETITSISAYYFSNYANLSSINLSKIETFECDSMSGCSSLPSVLILESAKNLAGNVFVLCTSLERVELPNVVTIADGINYRGCFSGCNNLAWLRIGPNCTKIGSHLRSYSTTTTPLNIICEAVTPPTLGNSPFHAGGAMGEIYVPASSVPSYRSATNWTTYESQIGPLEDYEDGGWVKFADPAVEAICVANWDTNGSGYMSENECKAVTSIGTIFKGNTEITSFDELEKFTGVTTIVDSAFNACASLESLVIPESVVSIGKYAFKGTSSLAIDIIAPNVVGTFGDTFENSAITGIEAGISTTGRVSGSAFQGSGIKWAVFPNMATTGAWAFRNTPLENIFFGQNLTSIDSWAFNGCANLTAVVCLSDEPPTLNSNTIPPTGCSIYVKEASAEKYKSATNWASRATNIKPISEIPTNTKFYDRIKNYL